MADILQRFTANDDSDSTRTNRLRPPIYALCVRLHPKTYHGYVAMRFDLKGCTGKDPNGMGLPLSYIQFTKIYIFT